MSNTYEAFVDIKEYDPSGLKPHIFTQRYVIDAASRGLVEEASLFKAEHEFPKATEFDVRLTRLIH